MPEQSSHRGDSPPETAWNRTTRRGGLGPAQSVIVWWKGPPALLSSDQMRRIGYDFSKNRNPQGDQLTLWLEKGYPSEKVVRSV